MTPAERELEALRKRLLSIERHGQSQMATSFKAVIERMQGDLDSLMRQIEQARDSGETVNAAWLRREARYASFLRQMEKATLEFLKAAVEPVEKAKREAVEQAMKDTPKLTKAVMGPAPAAAQAEVAGTFDRLPFKKVEQIVKNAADDRPLGRLFARVHPDAAAGVRNALASGVARGRGVKLIAKDVQMAVHMPLMRATTIAREEVMRAYRQTTTAQFDASDVVEKWMWDAAFDERTCEICLAMTGSIHPASEDMDSHVLCRCVQVPVTKTWHELGVDQPTPELPIEDGESWFARQPESEKLAILGQAKLAAYNNGAITLSDLVRPTRSEFGNGLRTATLKELSLR